MNWLLGGGFTGSVLSFLYPVLRFVNPPAVPEASVNEVNAGKVAELKPNSAKMVKFGARPALLIRVNETEWRAFSAICTHLNCTVQFHEAKHQIWCACHNGLYDLNGQVVSGPPPKPLEEFAVHIRGEEIVIARRA
ncbi:MAG: Rieske (2Fe-2S) protein [Acidobacteria bacterium]|nr:Rieske (2Fe-2S) protein [Acidobacteriota bacterium]